MTTHKRTHEDDEDAKAQAERRAKREAEAKAERESEATPPDAASTDASAPVDPMGTPPDPSPARNPPSAPGGDVVGVPETDAEKK